ncbi:CopD family protein [Qipengyuania sp. JC766]|uniref:CopD family protein n=1 Tax=Qipengyuania sp. JC766 TaxID=3232139 RepID=UPI003458C6AE
MQDALFQIYAAGWLTAGHIIFVIFWMAGLFMLPRQLVYMHPSAPGSEEEALWAGRSALLRKMILTPSLIIVWTFGLLMMVAIGAYTMGWFHAKLLLVLALSGYHGWMVVQAKKMARGERPLTDRQLRLWGEVPAVAAALIVILAVVKPF